MARYSVNNLMAGSQQVLATTNKAIIGINAVTGATTLRRGWIDEIEVGADGAAVATDCQIDWTMAVQTAAGTGTAATPQPTPDGADAAALLTYRAAWRRDVAGLPTTKEAAMAKMTATETAQRVIDRAVQMFGARGVRSGEVVESLYREIRALRIYEGATEVQKLIVARETLKSA